MEEIGVQWAVVKFVLLADPTFVPKHWFLQHVHLPEGFLYCWVGYEPFMGSRGRFSCRNSLTSAKRARISKPPLSLVKWERYLLLGCQNEAFGSCHRLFSDVIQIRYLSSRHVSGSPPLKWGQSVLSLPTTPYSYGRKPDGYWFRSCIIIPSNVSL